MAEKCEEIIIWVRLTESTCGIKTSLRVCYIVAYWMLGREKGEVSVRW